MTHFRAPFIAYSDAASNLKQQQPKAESLSPAQKLREVLHSAHLFLNVSLKKLSYKLSQKLSLKARLFSILNQFKASHLVGHGQRRLKAL